MRINYLSEELEQEPNIVDKPKDTPLLLMTQMQSNNQPSPWFRYPRFNWKKKHAVVVGGGIAGCQSVWHLCQQGWQVTLIERENKVAQCASGNPAGIISPKMTAKASSGEDFYVSCFKYAIQQLSELKIKHSELDWHACGLLQLAHNDREQQRWETLKHRQFETSFLQCINQNQASEIAGIPIDYNASYFPEAGWINPVSYCEVLLDDCKDNCTVLLESDAIKLVEDNNHWQVLDKSNKQIASAEVVIVTSGKDLNQFRQTNQLPSMPVTGQTTNALSNDYSQQLKTTIGHEGYLTPVSKITSQLTFGATFDRDVDGASLDSEKDKYNLDQLQKYLPQLADSFEQTESAHVATRMTTPDRFPYVGGIADKDFYLQNYADLHQGKQFKNYPNAEYLKGLFVLAGLGSRGLTTNGLCAKLLTEIIEGDIEDEWQAIPQHCHPARFIIKDLKRNKFENI